MSNWNIGVPPVPAGKEESYWCAVRNNAANPKVSYRLLNYGNKYVMPLGDSQYEAPANAVPIGDDGDFEWTGWWEESCEHCDTYWMYTGEVIAWTELPHLPAIMLSPAATRAAEPNQP